MTEDGARVALAVVSGSGLAVVPESLLVKDEASYASLGWPATGVAGHPNRLLTAQTPGGRRVMLAAGRPHVYEGWSEEELARPVEELAGRGARVLVLTCAVGGLTAQAEPGTVCVVESVIDLQTPPLDETRVLAASAPELTPVALAALQSCLPAFRGRYVAVTGPQYETPAEAAWLATLAEVVGMSGAAELRAAARLDLPVVMLAVVVNQAGRVAAHGDVLAGGRPLLSGLGRALGRLCEIL